jgi:hypothetical protein
MLQKRSEQDSRIILGEDIVKRELIEIGHEWMCSQCGCQFYNPGSILDGLTLNEIMLHVKKMREQAFANHACLLHQLEESKNVGQFE